MAPVQRLGVTMLLPTEDFAVRMGVPKPAASAPVVTMCMAGIRAKTAQLALMGMGYNNVRWLFVLSGWPDVEAVMKKKSYKTVVFS